MRVRAVLPFALRCLVGLGLGTLAAACVHAEPYGDGVLRKGELTVRLGPVPAAWRRVAVEGADVAYRDASREGSALFDVSCRGRDDDAPLSVLTEHLIMGTTDRLYEGQDAIPFDGREALHTVMTAKLDGVPMQYDIFVMKKDGCVFDLVYIAPPAYYPSGAAAFERFALGLHASSPFVARDSPTGGSVTGQGAAPSAGKEGVPAAPRPSETPPPSSIP